jgi:hypothetical protein
MLLCPDQTLFAQGIESWRGASGRRYLYNLHMLGTVFGPGAANFIYAREIKRGLHFPVYVGQTADLSDPIADSDILECIRRSRPTHIHVRYNEEGLDQRIAEQADLIAELRPLCSRAR